MAGISITVTGTMISFPSVGLFLWSSTMTICVIPTLYPANPCSTGVPSYSGHDWYLGTGPFALFRGLNARDPFRGVLIFGIFHQSFLDLTIQCSTSQQAQTLFRTWVCAGHTAAPRERDAQGNRAVRKRVFFSEPRLRSEPVTCRKNTGEQTLSRQFLPVSSCSYRSSRIDPDYRADVPPILIHAGS